MTYGIKKGHVEYRCSICGSAFQTEQSAQACVDTPVPKAIVEVGEFAIGSMRFGWFDGDETWIAESEPAQSASGYLYAFIYVVTHIDNDGHRLRYHLETLAMTGESGYRNGYIVAYGDWRGMGPKKFFGASDLHREAAKKLIGLKSRNPL